MLTPSCHAPLGLSSPRAPPAAFPHHHRLLPPMDDNDSARRLSQGLGMASTYETVAGIISDTCDIEPEKITPDSHAINDLGIDSLDFLDVAFAIDKAFGIKMPLEQWTQDVNAGTVTTDEYFVLKNLCANIDKLVAAKAA
jgi:acyl carrier protein